MNFFKTFKFQRFQKPVPHHAHVSRDISNPALEMLFLVVSNMFILEQDFVKVLPNGRQSSHHLQQLSNSSIRDLAEPMGSN